jgi:hypothetical protein
MRTFGTTQRSGGSRFGLRFRKGTAVDLCVAGLAIPVAGIAARPARVKERSAALVISFLCQETSARSVRKSGVFAIDIMLP